MTGVGLFVRLTDSNRPHLPITCSLDYGSAGPPPPLTRHLDCVELNGGLESVRLGREQSVMDDSCKSPDDSAGGTHDNNGPDRVSNSVK